MYILYQTLGGYPLMSLFHCNPEEYQEAKPMSPSMCQWIIPGTVSPLED